MASETLVRYGSPKTIATRKVPYTLKPSRGMEVLVTDAQGKPVAGVRKYGAGRVTVWCDDLSYWDFCAQRGKDMKVASAPTTVALFRYLSGDPDRPRKGRARRVNAELVEKYGTFVLRYSKPNAAATRRLRSQMPQIVSHVTKLNGRAPGGKTGYTVNFLSGGGGGYAGRNAIGVGTIGNEAFLVKVMAHEMTHTIMGPCPWIIGEGWSSMVGMRVADELGYGPSARQEYNNWRGALDKSDPGRNKLDIMDSEEPEKKLRAHESKMMWMIEELEKKYGDDLMIRFLEVRKERFGAKKKIDLVQTLELLSAAAGEDLEPWYRSIGTTCVAQTRRAMPKLRSTRPADPAGVTWGLGQPAIQNAWRRRWSLAGWWRIQPIGKGAPVGQWAFVKVSDQNLAPRFMGLDGKPLATLRTDAGARQAAASFERFALEREFTVPAANKAVWVRFGNVEDGSRVVFCNGRLVGEMHSWARGEFNLTPFLVQGRNRLVVVLGEPVEGETWVNSNWDNRKGIVKSTFLNGVWLEVRPKVTLETHAPMLIATSWRKREIVVVLPMSNSSDSAQEAGFSGVVTDAKGREIARLKSPTKLNLEAKTAPARRQVVLKWPDPVCWHDMDPRMLTLRLQVHQGGEIVDAVLAEAFGFREIWTEGRDLIMNGRPIHLRGNSHNYLGYGFTKKDIESKKRVGMNADRTVGLYKSTISRMDSSLDVTDEMGHYVTLRGLITDPDNAEDLAKVRKCMTWMVEAAYNHPSFILHQMWRSSDYTGFMNGPWAHPMQLGEPMSNVVKTLSREVTEGVPADIGLGDVNIPVDKARRDSDANRFRKAMVLVDMYRQIDPSRPSFYYRRGVGGDVRGLMFYWGQGTPAQVMAEVPRYWAEHCDQPMIFNEVSLLMMGATKSIMGEWFAWQSRRPIPLVVEHAARHLGDDAYRQVDDRLVGLMNGTLSEMNRTMQCSMFQTVKAGVYKRALRAWRTYGISYLLHNEGPGKTATMQPATDGLSETGRVFQRNNGPFLSYIGGPEGDFVRQDHAFFSGETVRKQIIIRNDLANTARASAVWKVRRGKKVIAQGRDNLEVASGALGARPISFTAPSVSAKTPLTLTLDVTAGGIKQSDSFAIEVFPTMTAPRDIPAGAIGLIDPVGDTASMLKRAGVRFKAIEAPGDLARLRLLIIGREFYSQRSAAQRAGQLGALKLDQAVADGLNVLVMEQGNDTVMGLRNWQPDARKVFVRAVDHPLLAGLTSEDMRNWRAQSSMVEAYPRWTDARDKGRKRLPIWMLGDTSKHGTRNQFGRRRFWHWSNNGIVSTYWYEKPQTGNVRVLLDGGFDQYFTPLLEMRSGKGRMLFCQLDVTGRYGLDPVATLLVNRMLKQMSASAATSLRPVAYLGDAHGATMLDRLGVRYQRVIKLTAADAGRFAAVVACPPAMAAGAAATRASLTEYAQAGGTVFLMPIPKGKSPAWLPVSVTIREKPVRTTMFEPKGLLAGVAPSQLFWRSIRPTPVAVRIPAGSRTTDSGVITEVPMGKGRIVLVQIVPEDFKEFPAAAVKPKTAEEHWNMMLPLLKAKTRHLWQTMLSNTGAAFETSPQADDVAPIGTKNGRLYPEKALPFDPDMHHTW
ncbi:MAG: hypothetical protein J7M14_07675 [Planctomycetes bacterium]|nr:hypothetical protein [Planctomycetota bacterium]